MVVEVEGRPKRLKRFRVKQEVRSAGGWLIGLVGGAEERNIRNGNGTGNGVSVIPTSTPYHPHSLPTASALRRAFF